MLRLPQNTALRAGLFMVLAMGSFVTNDTLIKVVGRSLPVGEIIMLRGFMAFLIIGTICFQQGALAEIRQLTSRVVFALLSYASVDASTSGSNRWCVAVLSSDPQRLVGSLHSFYADTAVRPVALIHPAMLYVQPAWGGH